MAGLYIHIPFCRHKCAYCDFFSAPVRGDVVEQYLDALLAEWRLRRHELGSDPITTLYIGGGTPSMVPLNAMRRFMEALGREIPLGTLSEATIEANPEDITAESIAAYRAMGFNRISVGIQSFDSGQLDAVDRRHTPQASRDALRALSLSGINYSADLIYGLPGQSTAQWQENLAELLSYRPPHFSSYLLSYEPGTRLYARLMKGEVEEASDALAQQMYAILCEAADSHGYHHYEISNLALPGREAIHSAPAHTASTAPCAASIQPTLSNTSPPLRAAAPSSGSTTRPPLTVSTTSSSTPTPHFPPKMALSRDGRADGA